jgi:hypothetical protein
VHRGAIDDRPFVVALLATSARSTIDDRAVDVDIALPRGTRRRGTLAVWRLWFWHVGRAGDAARNRQHCKNIATVRCTGSAQGKRAHADVSWSGATPDPMTAGSDLAVATRRQQRIAIHTQELEFPGTALAVPQ